MSYLKSLNWRNEIIGSILIFLLGSITVFIWNSNEIERWYELRFSMFFSGLMWVFLWQGNGHLSSYITSKVPWLENPGKRFIIGIIGVVVYSPLAVYLVFLIILWTMNIRVSGVDEIALIAIGVTFVISFFMNAAEFLRNWRRAALDAEMLKKEQMATKYESLKNQVNPHFLFNSLNALTNLVYEDQDMAADFIRQLSKVYRYVLDTKSQEVVSLADELKFVASYLVLQKTRFDDKLRVQIDLKGFENRMVPPISLQILLENAIKHNVISEEDPLDVKIYVEDEQLVVSNNLQKKNIPIEESAGMGLPNIVARFEFLSNKKVEIIDGPENFIVKLPLLDMA